MAALAAQGLTNAEIAERLFVGAVTAKSHLHRVFVKLGIRSRAELAGLWLDEQPPTGAP